MKFKILFMILYFSISCVRNEGGISINMNGSNITPPGSETNLPNNETTQDTQVEVIATTISADQSTYSLSEDVITKDITFTKTGPDTIGATAFISAGDTTNFELTINSFVGDEDDLKLTITRTGGNPSSTTTCEVTVQYTNNKSEVINISAIVPAPPSAIASDTYTDPDPSNSNLHSMVAYSLRRIVSTSSYSGPLFRAIRDGDNLEADFHETNSTDLQAWITEGGGTKAYIVSWYDQSGSNEHFHQTTHSSRPELIADCSGSGATAFPCIRFAGKKLVLNDPSSAEKTQINVTGGMAMFIGIRFNSAVNHIVLSNLSAGNCYQFLQYASYGNMYYYGTFQGFVFAPTYGVWSVRSIMELSNNANSYAYNNGNLIQSMGNIMDIACNNYLHDIGYSGNFDVTEFVIINNEISRENSSEDKHGQIVNDMKTFYGIN